jgi:hypothetical protein
MILFLFLPPLIYSNPLAIRPPTRKKIFSKPQTTMSRNNKTKKVNNLVNKVVNEAIETPIAILKERIKETPKEQLVEKIQATTTELIKLQYNLREYSIVEWYENELDDRRKHLHDVFERNREFFKAGANGDNWLAICNSTKTPANVKGFEEFNGTDADNQGPYWFAYFKDPTSLNRVIDSMRKRDTNKLLCVPLFRSV